MHAMNRLLALSALMLAGASAHAGLATFDDLAAPPAVDSSESLVIANNGSAVYGGVTWDSRFQVVGDAYRIDTATPGPLFGLPQSGHYFVTNRDSGSGNDGLTINTDKVLTGAWFGRNEYYGFGGGADQITLNAMNGIAVLASVVFDLPELVAGQAEQLSFVDTSAFAALSGITGYRIDRREIGTQAGNWVADDFTFVNAGLPEPGSVWLMAAGLLLIPGWKRKNPKAP